MYTQTSKSIRQMFIVYTDNQEYQTDLYTDNQEYQTDVFSDN